MNGGTDWTLLGVAASAGAGIIKGGEWLIGMVSDRTRRDTKAKAVDEQHQETLDRHEKTLDQHSGQLRKLELTIAEDMATLKQDVHYIRQALEQRN